MRTVLLPLSALALVGAAGPVPPAAKPAGSLAPAMREIEPFEPSPEYCRDRITQTREAAGKPPLLDRGPASPDKPHRIYAVDKRIDGCAVMVMHGDVNDVRPLPERPKDAGSVIPLMPLGN